MEVCPVAANTSTVRIRRGRVSKVTVFTFIELVILSVVFPIVVVSAMKVIAGVIS